MTLADAITRQAAEERNACKPILRWAGGKRWLAPRIAQLINSVEAPVYHEPFLGGGAVFFGTSASRISFLGDTNRDLIDTYKAVRSDYQTVYSMYSQWPNVAESYYKLRALNSEDPSERAARFIYLNHHSYNGIHRVNLRGQYNVPFGARSAPNMPSLEHLAAASDRLADAHLAVTDFGVALERVSPGDLVFLDPPYIVPDSKESFVKYTSNVFQFADQERLAEAVRSLVEREAYFILSNAAHPSISNLFRAFGKMYRLTRRNSIGGKAAVRGQADEYVFTNIRVHGGVL